jgi:putative transposase
MDSVPGIAGRAPRLAAEAPAKRRFDRKTAFPLREHYFVTICTHHREKILGALADQRIQLSVAGAVALAAWLKLPQQFPSVVLRECMVLPNQLLGIVTFVPAPLEIAVSAKGTRFTHDGCVARPTLAAIIRAFQSSSTGEINWALRRAERVVWQRSHYEHTIRSGKELNRIRNLIFRHQSVAEYRNP